MTGYSVNDPAAVEWLDKEGDKTHRAREVWRRIIMGGHDQLNDQLPEWLIRRVHATYSSHHQSPIFSFKDDQDGGTPWIVQRFTYVADENWEPELL